MSRLRNFFLDQLELMDRRNNRRLICNKTGLNEKRNFKIRVARPFSKTSTRTIHSDAATNYYVDGFHLIDTNAVVNPSGPTLVGRLF